MFKFSQHNADMALVIISMGRVVCQLASLCKLWGCRRRQLAGPGCEKQTHLVKLHPYYLIRWSNEGEGFSFCLQASGYVLRERCQQGSVRHKSRKSKKKEVEQCTGGSQPLHREDGVMAEFAVYCVFYNLCGCLHSVCMSNH